MKTLSIIAGDEWTIGDRIPTREEIEKSVAKGHKQCYAKKRFRSERHINDAISIIKYHRDILLRSYFCVICAGFHLTSQQETE